MDIERKQTRGLEAGMLELVERIDVVETELWKLRQRRSRGDQQASTKRIDRMESLLAELIEARVLLAKLTR
jgi:hypothetical protein